MILKQAILALTKDAEGHEVNGLQVAADEATLVGFAQLIKDSEEEVTLNLDHGRSIVGRYLSKVGALGRVIKESVNYAPGVLRADVELFKETFSDKFLRIGHLISLELEQDKSLINFSLESGCVYEAKDGKAYIRPVRAVSKASFVTEGAITDSMFSKEELGKINTILKGDITMSEEVKKEEVEVKQAEAPVAPEVKAEDKKEEPKAEEKTEEKVEAKAISLEDVSAKQDKILEALTALSALFAKEEPKKEEVKVEESKLSAKETAKVVVNLAKEEPVNQKVETGEPLDLAAKWKEYWVSRPDLRPQIRKLAETK